MTNPVILYIAAAITFLWGLSHLFPTASVVRGFGDISEDNRNIIKMEWITEGIALIFIGIIVTGVTYIGSENEVANFIYVSSSVVLVVLAIVSLVTGFRIILLPFKLCPYLFTISAVLILLGS